MRAGPSARAFVSRLAGGISAAARVNIVIERRMQPSAARRAAFAGLSSLFSRRGHHQRRICISGIGARLGDNAKCWRNRRPAKCPASWPSWLRRNRHLFGARMASKIYARLVSSGCRRSPRPLAKFATHRAATALRHRVALRGGARGRRAVINIMLAPASASSSKCKCENGQLGRRQIPAPCRLTRHVARKIRPYATGAASEMIRKSAARPCARIFYCCAYARKI